MRAQSVRKKIESYGVDASRMEYKGFGASRPLPNGQDDKRVEINVLFDDANDDAGEAVEELQHV